MLKNKNYIYGPTDIEVPSHLHVGHYMLDRLMEFKDGKIINGQTHELTTLGQIAQQSMNLAVSLTHMGIRKGDVIGLCSENRVEFWSSVIGTILSGAVLTTINMNYTKGEITHVLGISKPKYIICSEAAFKTHEKTFKSLRHIKKIIVYGDNPKEVSYNDLIYKNNVIFDDFVATDVNGQEDLAFILYSSGTTGLPKGVMLTHLNCLNTFCHPRVESPFEPIVLTVNPWFHAMGLMAGLLGFSQGRTTVFLPRFEMDLYLRTIEKYKVTVAQVVPPILVALTKTDIKYDVSSIMMVFCGAAPLSSEVSNAIQKIFPNAMPVLQGYGMTEATLAITRNMNIFQAMPGCVGEATYTAVIKVIDLETKEPLGPNKPGEVCVKGGMVMKGYVGKDRKEDFDDEGFFRTGDVAYYDEDGNFYIVDRLKELIKYKGFQVAPAEIEAVLLQHPAVRDAGVVGVPDAQAGEVPRAFVALQPTGKATTEELQAFVAERLSKPKHLRGGVRFVPDIPKNPSGKIMRRELRKLAQEKSKL
ncbi:uncharacterized protein LOC134802749 [Cydia splendana]|uniref:uncharacterized protein LOC134802749 n=1 Tax=Cydia splendana TaxID=1100963 RepID=UPI0021381284